MSPLPSDVISRSLDSASPTVFHMLERLVGKKVLAVINRDFGYEGKVAVVSHQPPGIWLSESDAVILRSTVVSPIPQIVNREPKGEIFLHLDAIQRLETISEGKANARR
ncbi:MAG TPA: hypothetical protein VGS11_03315 [Candidatus Bathyarchaeia archaeon]|nr:hypothetical protein [Candidatus Bathyarchaeia archaeon]